MNIDEAKRSKGNRRSKPVLRGAWPAAATMALLLAVQASASAGTAATAKRQVFVRQAADLSSPAIATLKEGATVDVEEQIGEFARVRTAEGRVGYVRTRNLSGLKDEAQGVTSVPAAAAPTPPAAPPKVSRQIPEAPASTGNGGTRATAIQQVNVRQAPDLSSAVITALKKNEEVTIEQEQGEFVRIRTTAGRVGYLRRKNLALQGPAVSATPPAPVSAESTPPVPEVPAPPPVPSAPPAKPEASTAPAVPSTAPMPAPRPEIVRTKTRISLNVREAEDMNSPILVTLKKGTPVTMVENLGEFARVRTQEGVEGYVPRMFLDLPQP